MGQVQKAIWRGIVQVHQIRSKHLIPLSLPSNRSCTIIVDEDILSRLRFGRMRRSAGFKTSQLPQIRSFQPVTERSAKRMSTQEFLLDFLFSVPANYLPALTVCYHFKSECNCRVGELLWGLHWMGKLHMILVPTWCGETCGY